MNRIETYGVPVEDRVAYWRAEMGRATGLQIHIDVESNETFEMHSVTHSLGALAVGQVWGAGHRASLQGDIGKETDVCLVVVPRVSNGRLRYRGSEIRLAVNQVYVLDVRDGCSFVEDQRFRHLFLSVPTAAVPRLAAGCMGAPLIRPLAAATTLVELMKLLVEAHLAIDLLTDPIRETIADTLCGLIDTGLDPVQAHTQGRATTRKEHQVRRIRDYVMAHLADPLLSAESVAAAIGISPRHMHRLLSEEAQALGPLIRAERLDRCRAELSAPGSSRSISTVAYAWGFNDAAHFSRAFRQRFGMTPREARVAT